MPPETALALPAAPGRSRFIGLSRPVLVLILLGVVTLVSVACFMTLGAKGSWSFIIPFRGRKLLALGLVAYSVAISTLLFQTVTNNRILTPSIMGFDALYVLLKTGIVFFLGAGALTGIDPQLQFGIEIVVMVVFSGCCSAGCSSARSAA